MKTKLSALALLLTLSLALSACGENRGNGDDGSAGPSGTESASDESEVVGEDQPADDEDDDFAETTLPEGDATNPEAAPVGEVPSAAPIAEGTVIVPPAGASRSALLGSNLHVAKVMIDEAHTLAEALLNESNEYFRAHAAGNRSAQTVMRNNASRMEINLRRASRIVTAWYERGSERLANTPRFRSEYSRLRAALRRARGLSLVLRRVGRRNEAIGSFDSQITALVTSTGNALTELNSVVGTVRAPRARAAARP